MNVKNLDKLSLIESVKVNEETRDALYESLTDLPRFASVEDLMKDLNDERD